MRIYYRILSFFRDIPRHVRWWWQRRTWGWDERDIWSLDYTAAKWLVPRLKLMRAIDFGHPCNMTADEWRSKLDTMIAAFEWFASEERWSDHRGYERHAEGLRLFAEYYASLWT